MLMSFLSMCFFLEISPNARMEDAPGKMNAYYPLNKLYAFQEPQKQIISFHKNHIISDQGRWTAQDWTKVFEG